MPFKSIATSTKVKLLAAVSERRCRRISKRRFTVGLSVTQPSACEVVWNPAEKWMLLGTPSTKTVEAFLEHFERHFALYPLPLYHVHWGLSLLPVREDQKAILSSMVPVQSPEVMEEARFLGYEFMTWLWSFTETGGGLVERLAPAWETDAVPSMNRWIEEKG